MKKGKSFVLGMLAIVLALGFVFVGCDTGTSLNNDGDNSGVRVFSVSGSFTKAGGEEVKFDLESDRSAAMAVAADSYTVSGVLEDGDLTIRLKGSYDPNTGNWSVSANSSTIIYSLDGNVNSAGVSQGSSATIAVYDSGTQEWVPYIFPITEAVVIIPDAAEAEDGETGGMPSFTQGYWHSDKTYPGGYLQSISLLISDWRVTATGTVTSPDGTTMPIEQNWTLLEFTGEGTTSDPYYIVGCYPEYVMTSEDLAEAMEDYLGITSIDALTSAPGDPWPSGKWVYYDDNDDSIWFGGFTDTEYDRLNVFWATGGWETWAADNGVTKKNQYVKAKLSYSSGNTSFDMINMVKEGSDPWYYIYSFESLADLKAAVTAGELVEEHEWDWSDYPDPLTDLGVSRITFTR
jgi:hypothetical protein